jgi:hypothetical protein
LTPLKRFRVAMVPRSWIRFRLRCFWEEDNSLTPRFLNVGDFLGQGKPLRGFLCCNLSDLPIADLKRRAESTPTRSLPRKPFPLIWHFLPKQTSLSIVEASFEPPTAPDQNIASPFSSCCTFSDAMAPSGVFDFRLGLQLS